MSNMLRLNDDTITGIAMVPAMRICRRFSIVGSRNIDDVIDEVKKAIAEGLRVAADTDETDGEEAQP